MPPRTRASTRTSGVATRGSTQTQTSQKAEAPKATPSGATDQNARVATKVAPKPKPKPKPKAKAKPKSKPKSKAEKQEDPEPSRKRARLLSDKSGPKTGKASKAVLLISLPVEVLIQIARYVHPLDLIMLSRVNKFFRDLFMDKRSALVWRSAQENVEGLPPCPDEVSEPQYAAMIFTKRCSSCGGYAPREMNPILLTRACAGCWTKILVDIERVTDPSLVSVISAPPPGQSHGSKLWCLYDEAREVKIKLNELNKAGDENKLQKWKEERHKLVEAKRISSEPLSEWLTNRERERVQDREDLKVAHRKEIESRLTKLGWEESDFSFRDYGRLREWQSMVETTRALTDKAWDDLLPRLIAHLEVNRKKRLETEQAERKSARNRVISNWFKMIHDQLPPYARAKPRDINHPGAGISTAASMDKPLILGQALPDSRLACEWPELSVLVDNDVPHKQFLLEFERNKARFQMLIMGWREELEAHLIELLPDDAHPPNFDISPFALTTGAGKKGKPLDTLPRDIQRLLRADAIFTHTGVFRQGAYHYPHTFGTCGWNTSSFIYFLKAHEIVKALLSVLGLPDASHLGMEAYGKAFQCGRCPEVAAVGHRWRDIVSHYLESVDSWEAVTKQLERQRKPIKNFVYACAHDITVEDPERPLVRMCTEEPTIINNWKFSKCLLCQKAGLDATVNSQSIMDHLRYVHLVDEPQKGTHYKNK